jgi:hypothetical protein
VMVGESICSIDTKFIDNKLMVQKLLPKSWRKLEQW